jgi:hypothetical protein
MWGIVNPFHVTQNVPLLDSLSLSVFGLIFQISKYGVSHYL